MLLVHTEEFLPCCYDAPNLHQDVSPLKSAAQAAAHTAYTALVAEHCGTNLTGKTLGTSPGAVTLAPGVYCFASSAQLTGTLTLNGSGLYVFKIGSTLTTASKSSVVLAKGATAGNVFWQVGSSAALGTNTAFEGSSLKTGVLRFLRRNRRSRARC